MDVSARPKRFGLWPRKLISVGKDVQRESVGAEKPLKCYGVVTRL